MPQIKSKKKSDPDTDLISKHQNGNGNATASAGSGKKGSRTTPQSASKKNSEMLEDFLVDSLKDIYWAEKHLTKALPKLKKAATNAQLKAALDEHLDVTKEQIARLEQVFELVGKKAQAKKCEAMEGITKEAESIVEETEEGTSTRDFGIIMAAQKVEHYEIATYGGLVQLTKTMGLTEVSNLLAQTLAEEKETDQYLTNIAENDIDLQADHEDDEAED